MSKYLRVIEQDKMLIYNMFFSFINMPHNGKNLLAGFLGNYFEISI